MTRLRLRYTSEARRDLIEIGDSLSIYSMRAADRGLDRVSRRCRQLTLFPHLGRARPEIAFDARSLVVGRHLAFYRFIPGEIVIVRIVDARIDLSTMTWNPQ